VLVQEETYCRFSGYNKGSRDAPLNLLFMYSLFHLFHNFFIILSHTGIENGSIFPLNIYFAEFRFSLPYYIFDGVSSGDIGWERENPGLATMFDSKCYNAAYSSSGNSKGLLWRKTGDL